jgi:hypothetical protein
LWNVDFERRRATHGAAEVCFHLLANGGFSPSTYHRTDRQPVEADRAEIRDACYCIAQAFAEARLANKALFDFAQEVADKASIFVQEGPDSLSPRDRALREQAITMVSEDIVQLALRAAGQTVTYKDFEVLLMRLHALKHYPPNHMVSAVAELLIRRRPALSEEQRTEIRRLAEGPGT